ncbi:hypothetical protein QJS66_14005 [Kocuria rhizophila]|nr:hypothetical protein QJS66_14005 [Kocuria rhizophila]
MASPGQSGEDEHDALPAPSRSRTTPTTSSRGPSWKISRIRSLRTSWLIS